MPTHLTPDDARQSLLAHVAAKGSEIRNMHGPRIGWAQLLEIVRDRTCVRYPCEIVFDDAPLQTGELAHPAPNGDQPEAGFTLSVRQALEKDPESAVAVVLYQLVLVNYGVFASAADAEAFGSGILGISSDEYYQTLCRIADRFEASAAR